jgi:hypothetical protein
MIVRHSPGARRITLGADKGYDAAAFVADMRALNVTPHIAQNISGRRSAVDARTPRHVGYAVSQRKRKRIEEPFGWGKTMGGLGVEEPTKSQFHSTILTHQGLRPNKWGMSLIDVGLGWGNLCVNLGSGKW